MDSSITEQFPGVFQPCFKILVVDDDKGVCDVLCAVLASDEHDIIVANDGETALKLLKNASPDLVILDIRMPVIDGFEFLRRAKPGFDSPFSVIAISGDVKEEEITECYTLGACALIWKPFNITEVRKVVRRELRTRRLVSCMAQEHLRYKTLLEASPDIVFMLDANERCLFVNRQAANFLRKSPEEVIGRKQSELFNPATAERHSKNIKSVLASGKMMVARDKSVQQDGTESWIESRIVPMRQENGEPIGVLGLVRNVTEEEKLSLALRESEERFRVFFECASIGMGMVSLDGKIIKVNPSFCRMLGYEEAELISKPIAEISFPDDRSTSMEAVSSALNDSLGEYQIEKRYIHKSGRLVWVHLYVSLIRNSEGVPQYFIGQVEDISARKSAEEQLLVHKAYLSVLTDLRGITIKLPVREFWTAFLNDLVANFQLSMAWYGSCVDDRVTPLYWSRGGEKSLNGIVLDISQPDSPDAQAAICRAILSREPFGYADLENDEGFKKWRSFAIASGYRSNLALPILCSSSLVGGVIAYSAEKNAFGNGRSGYIHDLVREAAILCPPN